MSLRLGYGKEIVPQREEADRGGGEGSYVP